MKSKIQVYVGENINHLEFSCGGGEFGFKSGKVVYWADATHRVLPESGIHPRRYQKNLEREINWCISAGIDLIFNTNSADTFSILSQLILNKVIDYEQVEIYVLDEFNTEIVRTTRFTGEGCLDENWPYGFFEIEWGY